MSERNPPSASDSRDAEISRAVEEFIRLCEEEKTPEVDEFCRRYPHKLRAAILESCLDYLGQSFTRHGQASGGGAFEQIEVDTDHRGEQLGDFRIIQKIGRGAMGDVYLARQISLPREVALKVLRSHHVVTERQISRFRREASSAAKLEHTNIVRLIAVGEEGGTHFIAMEHIDGKDLAKEIDARWTRNEGGEVENATCLLTELAEGDYIGKVADVTAQIADALQYAHDSGIIHRDIKPQNVLLGKDGKPRVADFGLAKDVSEASISVTGEIGGTPYYMSPEQVMAKRVTIDHRTDIFSLGVVLYELLTLRRPFSGETFQDVFFEITFREPEALRRVNPLVPRDLETICHKAIEKNPEHRFDSASVFARNLRKFLAHEAIEISPPSLHTRFFRLVRRHRVAAMLVLISFLFLVIGLTTASIVHAVERRTQIESGLTGIQSSYERAMASGDVTGLHNVVTRLNSFRKDFGELGVEVESELDGMHAAIEKLGRKKKALGLAHLKKGKAAAPDTPLFEKTLQSDFDYFFGLKVLFEASLLLPDDEEVKQFADFTNTLPRITVESERSGAAVYLQPIDMRTNKPLEGERQVGNTPLSEQPVPPGYYRVIVEAEGLGFAEMTRYFDKRGREHRLRAWLRSTRGAIEGMKRIPAGEFEFGIESSVMPWYERRKAVLPDYWIDECEVSIGDYKEFLKATGHPQPQLWSGNDVMRSTQWDNKPVAGVSYYDSRSYAEWAGKRLPTYFEWEKAARGKDGRLFPWGDEAGAQRAVVGRPFRPPRSASEAFRVYIEEVAACRSFEDGRSPYGVCHMFGNVQEWTETMPTEVVPFGGRKNDLISLPYQRLVLGGHWYTPPTLGLSTLHPLATSWNNDHGIGFRCAKSVR